MNITVRGKNTEVTPALREYVEKRLGKLEKYLGTNLEAQVTLVVEKADHRVEVNIPINGMIIRGEEASHDMYASIDLVFEKLEKQTKKYKERISRRLRTMSIDEMATTPRYEDNVAQEDEVVKTKRFNVKPMPVEEAIMQMNLMGHNFFVFSNADTNDLNVVYKRKDGRYGLIEPNA